MNKKTKKAIDKYNEIVESNIINIENKIEKYSDPDNYSQYYYEVDNLSIYLSQDGLCGYKKIIDYSENIKEDYLLLHENMFDCLVWPAYAMSINQMRYSKYRDRLDLLLIDIQKLYQIINKDSELTPQLINSIMNDCELGRAYIFPYTFYWLRHFGSFKEFIEKRNLSVFVSKGNQVSYIAEKWTDSNQFDKEYYNELLTRVKKYKKTNMI